MKGHFEQNEKSHKDWFKNLVRCLNRSSFRHDNENSTGETFVKGGFSNIQKCIETNVLAYLIKYMLGSI
jgi:hypothetical protein